MPKSEKEVRDEIVHVCQLIYQKGWVAANDGNVSVRVDENRIICTPTATSKGLITADALIVCDMQGNKLEGRKERTSELAMHTTIMSMRPDVKSVVHAHPPTATGFATAGRPLNLALLPEVVIGLGCVPLASYGLPGTSALTDGMLPYIPKYDALLMANHGVVSYGTDVFNAFFRMETVEHYARIYLVAEQLGGAVALPRVEVEKLFDSRTRYGVKARAGMEPGCAVPAEDAARYSGSEGKIEVTREELIALVETALKARGIS